MRSKANPKKHAPPTPSLIPQLNFIPNSLPPPHSAVQGDGVWGYGQFIMLFLLLLPPQGGHSPASVCSFLYGRQSSKNSPMWDPPTDYNSSQTAPAVALPWVQSFRNSLLQCGFPTGSEVLPAHLSCLGFSVHGFPWPARSLLQCGPPMESQLSQDSSRGDRLFWSETDECSDTNCLTLFIFLTKKVKMMNSAPHEAQKSSKNLMKSMLKVSSSSQVQVDCQ